MLNAEDQYTVASLQRLREVVRQKRPVVFWIGAGASRWANLPSWKETARQMNRVFVRHVAGFAVDLARGYLQSAAYPKLFQLCKDADATLYNNSLKELLGSPVVDSLYEKLVESLHRISPLQVVTTNVDLCLEQYLKIADVIERSDLERCNTSIQSRSPFIAKIHGSISSIGSVVFTTEEYEELLSNESFAAALKSIFANATVVFLQYGLKDQYVIDLLKQVGGLHNLFGSGPHFLVNECGGPPEDGVHRIGYKTRQHQDHRAALTVLNFIEQAAMPEEVIIGDLQAQVPASKESAFYISHFRPSGTYVSGQALGLTNSQGLSLSALTGLGFEAGELRSSETVAFHDLGVGLICFDRVYLPLESLGALHLHSGQAFWPLMESGAVRFVDVVHDPFFVSEAGNLFGDVGLVRLQGPTETENRTSMSVVRKMISPAVGAEEQGNSLIDGLSSKIIVFDRSPELGSAQMTRDALLLPQVSRLLGFSDAIVTNRIPRWLAYPTIRLAHLVQTGLICNELDIRACRVPFGGVSLLSAAFSVKPAVQSFYDYASFIMSGDYGCNMSERIERNPLMLLDMLKFRESNEGTILRKEISDRLETNNGTEFAISIEGGLKKALPQASLQAAKDRFQSLMKAGLASASAAVLWPNQNNDDKSLSLWRDKSRERLLNLAKGRGVKSHDPCPCDSGDSLGDCCLRPLR